MFKKATTRDAKVVFTEVLQGGETVVIREEGAAPKKKQR